MPVQEFGIEIPSLTLGSGDNNGNGTIDLGIGMGGLGEPPVGAGFSEEVALSRRGSYAGLEVTVAGAGESQKAESVVSGGDRSQTRQPRGNVPSASQTEILPAQVPKVGVTTGRTTNTSHRRRNKKPFLHALSQVVDPHLSVDSTSKVIYALISIDAIGLDVGNMFVSNMERCMIISCLWSVRDVGSSLQVWMLCVRVRPVWSVLNYGKREGCWYSGVMGRNVESMLGGITMNMAGAMMLSLR